MSEPDIAARPPSRNAFVRNLQQRTILSDQDVSDLEALCSNPKRYPAKQDLIRDGDVPGPLYLFLDGWGCRYKILPEGTRQILAFLLPGDCCDLHTRVLDRMDHSIATVTPSLVVPVDRTRMNALMDKSLAITRAIWLMQLVDLGISRAWITSLGRQSSHARVAHLICEIYLRAHSFAVDENAPCRMPISQIMLADAVGLTPVHINRVLRSFAEDGIMRLSRGTLTVHDPEALALIAGFDDSYLKRKVEPVGASVSHWV